VAEIGSAATLAAEPPAPGGDTVFVKARVSISARCAGRGATRPGGIAGRPRARPAIAPAVADGRYNVF